MLQISSLPVELIQSIFILAAINYLDADGSILFEDRRRHLRPALTLSYVCSQWRSIALSTGQLWSHLVIFFSDSTSQELAMVAWQLKRAGSWPLDVILDTSGYFKYRTPSRTWMLIRDHFPRCQTISFPSLAPALYSILFPLPGSFPCLKNLSVQITDPGLSGLKCNSLFGSATFAPCLESLSLDGPHARMFDTVHLPALKSVHFLTIGMIDLHDVYTLLRDCVALTSLYLPLPIFRRELPFPASPLIFPHLSSLSISDCNLNNLIQCPSLRYLECWEYRGAIDRSNLSCVRELKMSFPMSPAEEWSPPAWMRDVETLTFLIYMGGIPGYRALCALEPIEPDLERYGSFLHFPGLRCFTVISLVSLPSVMRAGNTLRDLVAILRARADLQVFVSANIIARPEMLKDIPDHIRNRISAL
ncbi:hypothetical protein DL93DRAFT_1212300 [Clavulina sp. PMI_390]|nr:hypothetical protein DL93DRAFT_1212300 [Clavulina sp. PMI_390]